MPGDIPPPTQVLTHVLLAWTAGTVVLAAASRFWSEIQAGHFKVMWLVAAGLGFASGFGYHPAFGVAGLSLVTYVAVYGEADKIAGAFTAAAALLALGAGTDLSAESFAVALLLGAVTNAMLLGHWHLNQPRLGTKPIARLVWVVWAGIAAYLAVTATIMSHPKGVQGLGAVTGLAFAAFCLILTGMVQHLVRTRSIMSATGILYLEILMCLVAAFTGTLAVLAAP
jgi:hypothetical protein